MECFGWYKWPFSNFPIVEKIYGTKNIKVYFLVEGTFVKPNKTDENVDHCVVSPIDPNYRLRLTCDMKLNDYDLIITFNEIDVVHLKSLPDDHQYKTLIHKFVYVPYIPTGLYDRLLLKITPQNRDIDVLTIYTNESIFYNYSRCRRREFLIRLKQEPFVSVNLSGVTRSDEMASYFARSKVVVHVSQSEFHRNHAEISLLPAMCHGVIAVSEKSVLTNFQYGNFVVWSDENTIDSVISTIRKVLNNYEDYFNKLQGVEFDQVLKEMEKKAVVDLQQVGL